MVTVSRVGGWLGQGWSHLTEATLKLAPKSLLELGNSMHTCTQLALKVLPKIHDGVDLTNGVQALNIDAQIKELYPCIQPQVVKDFFDRFGPQPMVDIDLFAKVAIDKTEQFLFKPATLFLGNALRVNIQTLSLGTVTWVGNKLQTTMPSQLPRAKKEFAASCAQDVSYVVQQFQQATEQSSGHGDWGSPAFCKEFQTQLGETTLGQTYGNRQAFYEQLADRLLKKIEEELPSQVDPKLSGLIKSSFESLPQSDKKKLITQLLIKLHSELIDTSLLKELLSSIFQSSSESMEKAFETFMTKLESPQSPKTNKTHHAAYGQSLVGLLQVLQPRAFGQNVMGLYAKFYTKEQLAVGNDFLTPFIRDPVALAIEDLMAPTTDTWVKSALKIAREKLIDKNGAFIERPIYIPEENWNSLTMAQRLEACDLQHERGAKLKQLYIQKVDARFLENSRRMARSVFRAGFIVEQHLPTSVQTITNSNLPWYWRLYGVCFAFLRLTPVISFFRDLIHQLVIQIRLVIADSASYHTGQSIAQRADLLLKTSAVELLIMHLLEKNLDRLHLLAPKEEAAAKPAATL